MLHTAFQVATLALARKLGLSSWPALTLLAMCGAVVIALASIACYRFFEAPARAYFSPPLRWPGRSLERAAQRPAR
jgi:peptidoglycan/LPS O-acetylase OafA/YrhL